MPDFHIPNDPEWQWVYDLILYGVGEEFPKADPTALRAMGDELYAFTTTLISGLASTSNAGSALRGSLEGETADAFANFQRGITQNVPAGGGISNLLGGSAYQFALESEASQYAVVIAAFTMVVEIAIALMSGFGAGAVPALIKFGQELVKTLIDQLRARLRQGLMHLAWEGFEEGLEELWQSAAVQVTQMLEGNRKTLDLKDLGLSFAGGMFIGGGVSGVHAIGGKLFPKFGKNIYFKEGLGAWSETGFEGLFTFMLGGGFNPWATLSSSVIGGMSHHWAVEIGGSYGPQKIPNGLPHAPSTKPPSAGPASGSPTSDLSAPESAPTPTGSNTPGSARPADGGNAGSGGPGPDGFGIPVVDAPASTPPQTFPPVTTGSAPPTSTPTTGGSTPPATTPTTSGSVPGSTAPTTGESAPPTSSPATSGSALPATTPTTDQAVPGSTAPATSGPPVSAPTTGVSEASPGSSVPAPPAPNSVPDAGPDVPTEVGNRPLAESGTAAFVSSTATNSTAEPVSTSGPTSTVGEGLPGFETPTSSPATTTSLVPVVATPEVATPTSSSSSNSGGTTATASIPAAPSTTTGFLATDTSAAGSDTGGNAPSHAGNDDRPAPATAPPPSTVTAASTVQPAGLAGLNGTGSNSLGSAPLPQTGTPAGPVGLTSTTGVAANAPAPSPAPTSTMSTSTGSTSTAGGSNGETSKTGRADRKPASRARPPEHLALATDLPTSSAASPSVPTLPTEGGLPGLVSAVVPVATPSPDRITADGRVGATHGTLREPRLTEDTDREASTSVHAFPPTSEIDDAAAGEVVFDAGGIVLDLPDPIPEPGVTRPVQPATPPSPGPPKTDDGVARSLSAVVPASVSASTAETTTVGDPVDVATGRVICTETDARLPGLTLERTHRSDYRWGRCFGPGWASTLDQRVVSDARHARFLAADGSVLVYPMPAEGVTVLPVLGRPAGLRRLVGGGWLLTEGDRELLFGPADGDGTALLSDIVAGHVHWRIERTADRTPATLVSSLGSRVILNSADGLVTGVRFAPAAPGDTGTELAGFGYDEHRNLVEVRNSAGESLRLRYDQAGRIVRWDDRNREWYTYAYDEAGRCVAADGRDGYLRCSFQYLDGVTIVIDSLGGLHRYELNDRLQVVAVTDPLGGVTRMEQDVANRPISVTDPLGRTTRFTYTETGRPDGMIRPDGSRAAAPRDGVAGSRPNGVPETDFDLDGLGRLRSVRFPDGTATEFGWATRGDVAWRVSPDGSRQEWHFDGEGNMVERIDAAGRAVRIEYGPFNLPVAQVDEAGNRTEFGYDTELRLTTVTNPAGQVWSYRYDPAGHPVEETDFDGRTHRYTRDAAGQLIAHTDPAGETTHYAYDTRGRVSERRLGTTVTRLEYDANDNIAAVLSPDAEVRFERDEQGRIVAETINGRTVRTSYHPVLGVVEARTTPSGRGSRWRFDARGRPESLLAGTHLVRFRHDAAGREISRTIDDVDALRQAFDAAGRLTTQRIAATAEIGYSYDATDRVTAIADSLDGQRSFAADATGRIHAVIADGEQRERYDYDEAGNLVGAGGGRWEFDGTMLVRSDDAEFRYDEKGRLVTRIDATGAWRFTWDAEDRMVLAVTPGNDRWRYHYDGFGRRIAKQRLADDDTVLEEVTFAWSGDLLVEQSHRGGYGSSTTTWDYRPDGTAPVTQADDDELRALVTDLIGTPTHLVGADGSLRWWRTDLWGRGAVPAGTPLRFPGQYFDAETGLHYNRFRFYDPATARYLSPDPLGLAGGPNPTAYVPDPLTAADPLGLAFCKRPQPSLTPPATGVSNPAVPTYAATGDPTLLQAAPPSPGPLYAMPDADGVLQDAVRGTPLPVPGHTAADRVTELAGLWNDVVGPATTDHLRETDSEQGLTHQHIRERMLELTGHSPHRGAVPSDGATETTENRPAPTVAGPAARYPWLTSVNPYRDAGGEFETNCVMAAIATDMSLRDGEGYQAPPSGLSPRQHLANFADRPLAPVPNVARVTELMEAAGAGARAMLVIGQPVGHVINVVHDDHGVVYLDGQNGLVVDPATIDDQHLALLPTTEGIIDDHAVAGVDHVHDGLLGAPLPRRRDRDTRTHRQIDRQQTFAYRRFGDPLTPFQERLAAIGDDIIDGTKATLPKGAANQIRDIQSSDVNNFGRLQTLRASITRTNDMRLNLGATAAAAAAMQVGNCGENAAIAFHLANTMYASRLPANVQIGHVTLDVDHAFIVLGIPGRWETIVAVDPWQQNVRTVPVTEFNFSLGANDGRVQWFVPDGHDYAADAVARSLVNTHWIEEFKRNEAHQRREVPTAAELARVPGMYDDAFPPYTPRYSTAPPPPFIAPTAPPAGTYYSQPVVPMELDSAPAPMPAYGYGPAAFPPAGYPSAPSYGPASTYPSTTGPGPSTSFPTPYGYGYHHAAAPGPAPSGYYDAPGDHMDIDYYGGGRYSGADVTLVAAEIRSDLNGDEATDAFPWLPHVNPHHDDGGEFATNCVIAAIATDMTLQTGDPHQASSATPLPEEDLANYQTQQLGLPDGQAPAYRVPGLDTIRTAMSAAPDNSRGIVIIRGADSEISHAFNVVKDQRGVNFLDGQRGTLARRPEVITDLLFLPLTENISVPADANPASLSNLAAGEPQTTIEPTGHQDRTLAEQLAELEDDSEAQSRLWNDFRARLERPVTLSDGSQLRVLAHNAHGSTAHTRADLAALIDHDHGWLSRIDGEPAANSVLWAQSVDELQASGRIVLPAPVPAPAPLASLQQRYPGRSFVETGSLPGLMDAIGAMPDNTRAIIAMRPGPVGTSAHVINMTKGTSGTVVFQDGQGGKLADLVAIGPDGSIAIMQADTPNAPFPDVDTGRDAATTADQDAEADSNDDETSPAFAEYVNSAPFTDVSPVAVAKSTEETPTAADPIDLTTGRMILTETDAALPGLTLERTYRSDYRWGRSFGRSWASTLDQRVIVDGDRVRYLAEDGSVLVYPMPVEGDSVLPGLGRRLPLRRLPNGGWLLQDPASDRSLLFAAATNTESVLTDLVDAGVHWTITRDTAGTPVKLRSSAGAQVSLSVSAGLVTAAWLPDDAGTMVASRRFDYDRDGNLVEVVNSSGVSAHFNYVDGQLVQWEDRNGEWYTYTYDEAGRCVSTGGKGGYLRYRFDYQDGLTVVTDSLGAVRRYQLDDRLRVVAETDPLGATTLSAWDESNRLLSHTDPLGRTTTYQYEADQRPTAVTRPDSSRSAMTFDESGRPTSWTDFDGSVRNREFDQDGRVLAEIDGNGEVVRFDQPAGDGSGTAVQAGPMTITRNRARQILSMTRGGAESRYQLDGLGRVVSIEDERGVTRLSWTIEGDLSSRENPDGTLEQYVYDGERNLVEAIDSAGRRARTEYGAFDLVTARIDEEGNRTEYTYDTELRLTVITNPAGATWRYTYDANGRMVEESDFEGRTHRYAYDAAGQLVRHVDAAGQVIDYAYDLLGRVTERRIGSAVTRFEYDGAGRVVSATDADSEIRLERDALGRVISETVNGRTVTTSYDARIGGVTARTRPSGTATTWSYDESGQPLVLAAGGHRVRFGYSGGHEVSRTSDAGLALEQTFDERGRLASQRIEGVTDRRYAYDDADRLTAVHDAVRGDRTAGEEPAAGEYRFDALGRPVTRSDAAGDWQFTWDDADRLIEIRTAGGDRWRYRYDAFDRRLAKQRLGAKDKVLEEFEFVWSGELLVEQHHRLARGNVTITAWEYHPTIGHPIAQVVDGTVQTLVTDRSGRSTDVVGIDGAPAGDPEATPIRAGGRYVDTETGLHYDRPRWYDPAADRYLPQRRPGPASVA